MLELQWRRWYAVYHGDYRFRGKCGGAVFASERRTGGSVARGVSFNIYSEKAHGDVCFLSEACSIYLGVFFGL
jgi:hypothetical protein